MLFTRTLTVEDLTAGYLRRHYLFGIVLKDSNGEIMPDTVIQGMIDNNIVDLEQKAGVRLTPTRVYTPPDVHNPGSEGKVIGTDYDELGEALDWSWEDAKNWTFLPLRKNNVYMIERIRAIYGTRPIWTVPMEWIKLRKRMSTVQIAPNLSTHLSQLYIDGPGIITLSQALNIGMSNTYPQYWAIDYRYGIGDIPRNACEYMLLRAAMIVLEEFATAYNPGISSRSISLGSIFSESQTYTASAMYSLMSAQIETYRKRLAEIDEADIIRQLKGGALRVFSA